jgi:hypothetical protein
VLWLWPAVALAQVEQWQTDHQTLMIGLGNGVICEVLAWFPHCPKEGVSSMGWGFAHSAAFVNSFAHERIRDG